MNDALSDLVAASARLRADGTPHLIATVVRVRGSSYRRPGARMIATEHGRVAGSISGGCLEGSLLRRGWWLTANGPAVVEFDSSDPDDPEAVLGCGGVVEILLERGGGADDPLAIAERAIASGHRAAIATVFASTSGPIAQRWTDANAPAALAESCARAMASGKPSIEHVGCWTVLVEPVLPPLELFVFGTGLDAVPIVEAAARLGWRPNVCGRGEHAVRFPGVRVLDVGDARAAIDRADRAAAIVMGHDLRTDAAAIAIALASGAHYIGILGPRHRTEALAPTALRDPRVHAPVGLDLGAETPDEIAVAIVAEILAATRGATAASLCRRDAIALHA